MVHSFGQKRNLPPHASGKKTKTEDPAAEPRRRGHRPRKPVLIDKNAIFRVADILTPSDFYSPENEKIFDAILALYEKRQPIDVMTLTNYLKEKDAPKSVGGSSYLAELTNQVTTASHVEHYANIVKEKKVCATLLKPRPRSPKMPFSVRRNIEDLMDDIEQKILDISQKSTSAKFRSQ